MKTMKQWNEMREKVVHFDCQPVVVADTSVDVRTKSDRKQILDSRSGIVVGNSYHSLYLTPRFSHSILIRVPKKNVQEQ